MRGLSPHQAALKYALMDRNVSTAVPGVKTIEEIEECVAVMGTTLSKDDSDTLDQYDSYLQGRICTMCGGCEGECPHGVNHTDLLRVVMYHDGYNSDKLVDEMRRESGLLAKCKQCSECSSCSITCRRGLDIRAQIDRVMHILA
jgi:predicted aldo/keto reductase-like oxidoreductase